MLWAGMSIDEVTDELIGFFKDPAILIGIPLALIGAIFMSFGAQYQHRGVTKVERLSGSSGKAGLSGRQLLSLLKRPSWVIGTVMLGAAIICQLTALAFAPLIIVQPIGAISLVITTLLNARVTGIRPTRRSIMAIIACVGGIFLFVTIAAFYATENPITQRETIVILSLLGLVLLVLGGIWFWLRKRGQALFYIVASGMIYGFVATLAKVAIERIKANDIDWLTILTIVALLAAVAIGAYFVQTAYAVGPPDLVIAGLTVIDPIVAVLIGLTVLQEAANAPLWAFFGFGIAGAIAIFGVITLARYHPQVLSDNLERRTQRENAAALDEPVDPPANAD